MAYRQDHTWRSFGAAGVTVCDHPDSVSMSLPSYMDGSGHGFAIYFDPSHLDVLDKVVAKLMDLREQQSRDECETEK